MSKDKVYVRPLEDGSGFGVFFGGPLPDSEEALDGHCRWEQCLGTGKTEEAALSDYEKLGKKAGAK